MKTYRWRTISIVLLLTFTLAGCTSQSLGNSQGSGSTTVHLDLSTLDKLIDLAYTQNKATKKDTGQRE